MLLRRFRRFRGGAAFTAAAAFPGRRAETDGSKVAVVEDDCVEPERATLLLDAVLEEVPDYADALIWRGRR